MVSLPLVSLEPFDPYQNWCVQQELWVVRLYMSIILQWVIAVVCKVEAWTVTTIRSCMPHIETVFITKYNQRISLTCSVEAIALDQLPLQWLKRCVFLSDLAGSFKLSLFICVSPPESSILNPVNPLNNPGVALLLYLMALIWGTVHHVVEHSLWILNHHEFILPSLWEVKMLQNDEKLVDEHSHLLCFWACKLDWLGIEIDKNLGSIYAEFGGNDCLKLKQVFVIDFQVRVRNLCVHVNLSQEFKKLVYLKAVPANF